MAFVAHFNCWLLFLVPSCTFLQDLKDSILVRSCRTKTAGVTHFCLRSRYFELLLGQTEETKNSPSWIE